MKFVGKNAVVEGKGCFPFVFSWFCWWLRLSVGGSERRRKNSRGLARRIVKDLTINWPPNRSPLTSELGLNAARSDEVVDLEV